jgi:glyoxylase-like metal-dependent hydrolase (beta-lactamase superfamily II)
MRLQEIAKDVYACLQPDRGLGWSNSGLINRAGGLVIDTFWDLRSTRELIENYSRVWREPVRRVFNTHQNGDHCCGIGAWGGRRPSLGGYVTVTGPRGGATPPPDGPSVAFAPSSRARRSARRSWRRRSATRRAGSTRTFPPGSWT